MLQRSGASGLPRIYHVSYRTPRIGFLFADDGSTDATAQTIGKIVALYPEQAELLQLPKNQGKAEAVRRAVLHISDSSNKSTWIGFWDADLATPLSEIPVFLDILTRQPGIHGIIGSRWKHLGAEIERSPFHDFTGTVVAALLSLFLRFPVYDSQCGAKIFKTSLAEVIFRRHFLSRWLFDVELFCRMEMIYSRQYLSRHILEKPLTAWRDVAESKLTWRHGLRIFWELAGIIRLYRNRLKASRKSVYYVKETGGAPI